VTVDYTQPPVAPPPPPPIPSAPPPAQKSSGCWKWGCIGCAAVLIVFAVAFGIFVGVIFSAIKGADVYRGALRAVQSDPRVVAALGNPIDDGWWIIGHVNVHDHSGEADFEFPISGPKGRARVHAVGTKENGVWHYSELTVTPSNGPPIDVLKP
jgi:hypothetical protein